MSVLGEQRILLALKAPRLKDRLVITPLLSPTQIGPGSVDVRLGNEFIAVRRANLPSFDPGAAKETKRHRYQAKHYVNFGACFHLHPNELVLASTLEYVRLPRNISAVVTTRSSWGRVGLVIATATAVHPGFTGCITLELINHGEVPLILYPGLSVAQLVLHDAEGAPLYVGKFNHHTGPQFGTVAESDPHLDFWTNKTFHP